MSKSKSTEELNVTEMFGDKEMRWYQISTRERVLQALNEMFKRILIVLPTGCGKTITIAATVGDPRVQKTLGVQPGEKCRVLFVAHKERLLRQAERTFLEECNVELITQSIFSDIPQDVLAKGWHVTVGDEIHHEACMSFQRQLDILGEKPIIGLTATPDRHDGMLIKFDSIIEEITRIQAVEQGYLAETSIETFVDYSGADKSEIVCEAIKNNQETIGRMMIFLRTQAEARKVYDYIQENVDSRCELLVGVNERTVNEVLDRFSAGLTRFIVNCNIINEGVDVQGCTDVFLARTYQSYPQVNQVIGRAARPDSDCRVWELVDPLNKNNLDTTVIVGEPLSHRLHFKKRGEWQVRQFNYTSRGGSSIKKGRHP